jgi:hypothetical protein
MKHRRQQKGGGSSDYSHSFYAYGADPAQLSRFTLNSINSAPMFNPLRTGTMIPTGTSGIIPTGAYYDSMAPMNIGNSLGPPVPGIIQMGGSSIKYITRSGKQITNAWIAHVYKYSEEHGITYSQALKDPHVKAGYTKSTPKAKANSRSKKK